MNTSTKTPIPVTPAIEALKSRQKAIWDRWAKTLDTDPSAENYALAYDEINAFLRDNGDPMQDRGADGTIYGRTGAEEDWNKKIIAALVGLPEKKVLELGCGDGRLAIAIARNGACVKGIDISRIAIESARRNAIDAHLPVIFELANAIEPSEPAGSYDYVVSVDVVEHLNPAQTAQHLSEVFRILKPGGAYVISIPCWEPPERVDILHLGNYHPWEFRRILTQAGFSALSAPEMLLRRTGDLNFILGVPKTLKAKIMRLLASLPVTGKWIQAKLLNRWCSDANFFFAQKAPVPALRGTGA